MICLWSQSCMGQAKDRAQAYDSSCSFMHTSLPAGPQGHWDSSMAFLATAYLAHFYQSSVDPDLKFISACSYWGAWTHPILLMGDLFQITQLLHEHTCIRTYTYAHTHREILITHHQSHSPC